MKSSLKLHDPITCWKIRKGRNVQRRRVEASMDGLVCTGTDRQTEGVSQGKTYEYTLVVETTMMYLL